MRADIERLFALSQPGDSVGSLHAWHKLATLLEEAQLHSCRVQTGYQESDQLSAQVRSVRIGDADLDCTKPNGVRVFSAYRHLPDYPGLQRMEMTSYPPKGPTIVIDRSTAQLPEVVQRFMYVRACEAFRQGFALDRNHRSQHEVSGNHGCTAIRALRRAASLNEKDFASILAHTRAREFSAHVVVRYLGTRKETRLDQALARCFYLDDEFEFEF